MIWSDRHRATSTSSWRTGGATVAANLALLRNNAAVAAALARALGRARHP